MDTPEQLVSQYRLPLYRLETADRMAALEALESYPEVLHAYAFGDSFHITLRDRADETALRTHIASDARLAGSRAVATEPTLEDAFLLLSTDDDE